MFIVGPVSIRVIYGRLSQARRKTACPYHYLSFVEVNFICYYDTASDTNDPFMSVQIEDNSTSCFFRMGYRCRK